MVLLPRSAAASSAVSASSSCRSAVSSRRQLLQCNSQTGEERQKQRDKDREREGEGTREGEQGMVAFSLFSGTTNSVSQRVLYPHRCIQAPVNVEWSGHKPDKVTDNYLHQGQFYCSRHSLPTYMHTRLPFDVPHKLISDLIEPSQLASKGGKIWCNSTSFVETIAIAPHKAKMLTPCYMRE